MAYDKVSGHSAPDAKEASWDLFVCLQTGCCHDVFEVETQERRLRPVCLGKVGLTGDKPKWRDVDTAKTRSFQQ